MNQPAPRHILTFTALSAFAIGLSALALVHFAPAASAQDAPQVDAPQVDAPQVVAPQATPQATPQAEMTASSLTAIPPRLGEDFTLKAAPGETIQTSVRVRNGSSAPMTVTSQAFDFIVDQNGSTPIPVQEEVSNRWSLASWLVLAPSVNEIAPGEAATINIVIEVPEDALPGGHYAMITHQPATGGAVDELAGQPAPASQLQQRVGTLLYFMVDGPINEAAFIRNFQIPKFSEMGPVPFSFEVDNQSDIHLNPQIGVEIYNLFGQKVETIEIESKNVFPFIAREFEGEWDRIWGFGPYQAKVVMSFGQQGQVAMAVETFWLLPITIILAGLVVIFTLIVLIIVIRRHGQHRRNNNHQQLEELNRKIEELEAEKLNQFDT